MSKPYAQENNSFLCADGIDNDGDGLIDCSDDDCTSLPNDGCLVCERGINFADTVLDYIPGCPLKDTFPEGVLGVSDWNGLNIDQPQVLFLGQGGSVKLGFTNNLLINSGDSKNDLWVFEIGVGVESSYLSLRPANSYTISQIESIVPDVNNDGFYEFGLIEGSTSGLDIDNIIPGYSFGTLLFNAIEIKDRVDGGCSGTVPGADIDAVCALSSIEFDCAGVTNGTAVIDDCGECLEPDDPNFNLSCVDCAGVLNGTAVIDDCGECLEPDDPSFNLSCIDCAGVLNGTAVIDDCGECLEPDDPGFNLSCIGNQNIFIPNAFSPNADGINDHFQIFSSLEGNIEIVRYLIFSRWGELLFETSNFNINSNSNWWNGEFKGKIMPNGVYSYLIEIKYLNNEIKYFTGDVSLVR